MQQIYANTLTVTRSSLLPRPPQAPQGRSRSRSRSRQIPEIQIQIFKFKLESWSTSRSRLDTVQPRIQNIGSRSRSRRRPGDFLLRLGLGVMGTRTGVRPRFAHRESVLFQALKKAKHTFLVCKSQRTPVQERERERERERDRNTHSQ